MSANLHRPQPGLNGSGKTIGPIMNLTPEATPASVSAHPFLLFYDIYMEAERDKTELLKLHFRKPEARQ